MNQLKGTRPNIVLIMADDMGFSDLGCYGGEIQTPNVDRLATEGLKFRSFYNNAVCMPTRASLLTGLYAHQVGAGFNARLKEHGNVTIAEVLRSAGYRTLMSGKWHNGGSPGELPVNRGFDRYYGLLSGCTNYFNPGVKRPWENEPVHKRPGDMRPWGIDDQIIHPFTPEDPDFYVTDAFTDKAVEFLDQYGRDDQPFFLYLPYTAPHFPMHARPEDIALYRGRYMVGWDEVRRLRWDRLVELGIVDERWGISDRDEMVESWASVEDRDYWDIRMAVYAAMIHRMDQGIGRVLDRLREIGKGDDTLVIFLSDNGGCGEHIDNTPHLPPGTVDTYATVDASWANASNTPFRRFKAFDHEGGISTPLVLRWPRMIREGGALRAQVGHVIDFMPTFAELAGVEYPGERNGHPVAPMEGISLLPAIEGRPSEDRTLFWECHDCRAARRGKWKIVSQGPARNHVNVPVNPGHEAWELYDMEADRCELNDLSVSHPDIVKELSPLWEEWLLRCSHSEGGFARSE